MAPRDPDCARSPNVLAANDDACKQQEEELERPIAAGVIRKDLRNCQRRAQDMHTCIC